MVQNDCIWCRKLVAPKIWRRELQSEFCDGLRITSRKPLKLRCNFISRCSKADYPYNRRSGNTELKSYHGYGNGQGDIWKIGFARCNGPITLLVFMVFVKNQNPLSRGGLKKVSRKSRDIQSHSQRWCELKCADSRAVTKQGLFDCEPGTRQTRWYSVTKPLVHSGRKKRSAIYRTVFTYGTLWTKISA